MKVLNANVPKSVIHCIRSQQTTIMALCSLISNVGGCLCPIIIENNFRRNGMKLEVGNIYSLSLTERLLPPIPCASPHAPQRGYLCWRILCKALDPGHLSSFSGLLLEDAP